MIEKFKCGQFIKTELCIYNQVSRCRCSPSFGCKTLSKKYEPVSGVEWVKLGASQLIRKLTIPKMIQTIVNAKFVLNSIHS